MSSNKFIFRNTPGMTLFRTTFMRMLWVPAVYTVLNIVMVSSTMSVGRFASRHFTQQNPLTFQRLVNGLDDEFHFFLLALAISALVGCTVFSYLNRVQSASFMHSLPLRREKLFFAHYAAGAVALLLPALITSVVIGFYVSSFTYGLLFFAVDTVYSMGVYSFATLVCQLSANTLGGIIFTGFGLFSPLITEGFVVYLLNTSLYGYTGEYSNMTVSRWCYLFPDAVLSVKGLIYVAAIFVFTALALLLYRKRNTELAGDLIAFPQIRKLLTFICGVLAGMCAYLIFGNLLMFLIFSAICTVLVNFAVRKKFTLKGGILPTLGVIILCASIFVTLRYDLTGFESRIPDLEDIESVIVTNGYYGVVRQESYYRDGKAILFNEEYPAITEPEDIEKVRVLHRDLIGNKDFYSSGERRSNRYIEYSLKNGKTLRREYTVYHLHNAESFAPVAALYASKVQTHQLLLEKVAVTNASLSDELGNVYNFDAAQAQRLREAINKDIMSLPYNSDSTLHRFAASEAMYIDFTYYRTDATYLDTGERVPTSVLSEHVDNRREYIYPTYTETLALLRELAPEALSFEIKDIENTNVTLKYFTEQFKESGYTYSTSVVEKTVVNPEDIKRLVEIGFELSGKTKYSYDSETYEMLVNVGDTLSGSIVFYEEHPEIAEIFERAVDPQELDYKFIQEQAVATSFRTQGTY